VSFSTEVVTTRVQRFSGWDLLSKSIAFGLFFLWERLSSRDFRVMDLSRLESFSHFKRLIELK